MKYIYLLKEDNNDYFKIGISKNPKSRVKQLQTGSSAKITLYKAYVTEYASQIEKVLHRRYKSSNVLGEWFNLKESHVDSFIEDCKKIAKNLELIDESKKGHYASYQNRISKHM